MERNGQIPARLYKYRDSSNRTLDMIVCDHLYFADPRTFNDPLDTQPCVHVDLDAGALKKIITTLIEQRISAEMNAAAKTMKVSGSKTTDHLERWSRRQADRVIGDIEYNAMDTEYDIEERKCFLLGHRIQQELLQLYGKGVVSLAERDDCPLMWSHYGDQHQGICMGYSVPADAENDVHKIEYGGSRWVKTSGGHADWKQCSPQSG